MPPFAASLRISCEAKPNMPGRASFKRNPRLPRNVPQILNDWQNQRHTVFSPYLFRFSLRIARNQRTVRPRRRLRRAKHAKYARAKFAQLFYVENLGFYLRDDSPAERRYAGRLSP